MSHETTRRRILQVGAGGLLAALAARWALPRDARAEAQSPAKARACILVWLNGGPSHIDTFDPKPGRPGGGPFKAIKARAPGMELSEHLPKLADLGTRLAIVRGLTSKEGNHQRAHYLAHTSYAPNPTVVHPSLGGWVSSRLGDPKADLPAFVSVNGPSAGAGFLGVENDPFVMQKAGLPPPNVGYAPGVDDARFDRRRAALDMLESRFSGETHDVKVDGRRAVYAKAVRMMRSPKVKAFDLSSEPEKLVKGYGETDFGRGCLLARRLVETGVKFVEVSLDGWDTHVDAFDKIKNLSATLDAGLSALLQDLADRRLLDSTLVVCLGEFGRTPKINATNGRDHYPQAFSALLAGGGVKGGTIHGETDADGAKVTKNPVAVPDLLATASSLLGMDPSFTVTSPVGRPISVTDSGAVIRAILA